jgi:hypothetical protein
MKNVFSLDKFIRLINRLNLTDIGFIVDPFNFGLFVSDRMIDVLQARIFNDNDAAVELCLFQKAIQSFFKQIRSTARCHNDGNEIFQGINLDGHLQCTLKNLFPN